MTGSTDPYLYPGTNTLRNLREIRDPGVLARFEAEATPYRLIQLIRSPVQGSFAAAHLLAIHRHIFQDVFAWAGEFRTVNISKDGHLFGAAAFIGVALNDLLQKLAREHCLRGTDAFSRRAGYYLGELNAIHPFREGNGRTQREFFRELAVAAGFAIDWSRVTSEQMIATSRLSFQSGDSSSLASLIALSMSVGRERHS